MKYGQDYYTLRSIFFDRVPPPVIHVHLRVFDVAKDIPIGASSSNASVDPNDASTGQAVEVEFPEKEKENFDLWVRQLWQDKDQLMVRFLESGSFNSDTSKGTAALDIPLKLRHQREVADAFCFFLPALGGYLWAKVR